MRRQGPERAFDLVSADEIMKAMELFFLYFALVNVPIFSQYFQLVSYINPDEWDKCLSQIISCNKK